jgi:hypothetical protein
VSYTDAPPIIDAARDALNACAAWTYGTGAIHYPNASTADAGPYAVLNLSGRTLEFAIYAALSVGALQTLGYALQQQLMSRFRSAGTGLIISSEPQASDVMETSEPMEAAGQTFFVIYLSCDVGITF